MRAHLDTITAPVLAVADLAANAAKRRRRPKEPSLMGATLRPGPATPLWNKLATDVAKTLRKRGEKAQLARLLGISRQRLHILIVAKGACPDAERTLLLQEWLNARRRGETLR